MIHGVLGKPALRIAGITFAVVAVAALGIGACGGGSPHTATGLGAPVPTRTQSENAFTPTSVSGPWPQSAQTMFLSECSGAHTISTCTCILQSIMQSIPSSEASTLALNDPRVQRALRGCP